MDFQFGGITDSSDSRCFVMTEVCREGYRGVSSVAHEKTTDFGHIVVDFISLSELIYLTAAVVQILIEPRHAKMCLRRFSTR